jgi:hypothetical protein
MLPLSKLPRYIYKPSNKETLDVPILNSRDEGFCVVKKHHTMYGMKYACRNMDFTGMIFRLYEAVHKGSYFVSCNRNLKVDWTVYMENKEDSYKFVYNSFDLNYYGILYNCSYNPINKQITISNSNHYYIYQNGHLLTYKYLNYTTGIQIVKYFVNNLPFKIVVKYNNRKYVYYY